jgi:DUF4097 and DUF4098 domain-containing protein YvlB
MPEAARMSRTAPAFILSLLLAATPAFAGDISKVNGSITAEAGQTYGELDTVNGSIRIGDGARTGDAETVNGSIRAGNDVETGGLSTVNGSIRAGSNARIGGNIETVNGSVFVDRGGIVDGNIETVNGAIGLVDTDVDGNVETVSGDVTIGIGSRVTGNLKISKPASNWLPVLVNAGKRKPRVVIGPDAVVDGELVFEREVTLYVHDSARIGKVTGAEPVRFSGPRAPAD